jgi:hypothetical protein
MPFQFNFQSFGITNTRSLHNDTDYVAIGMSINGVPLTPQTKRVGNVNNGQHNVGLSLSLGTINSTDECVFSYIIVNHGGDKTQNVLDSCAAAMTQTPLKQFNPPDAAVIPFEGSMLPKCLTVALRAKDDVNTLWNQVEQVFADLSKDRCDGVVVIDRFSFFGSSIAQVELSSPHTITYLGVDSRDGCGSDSVYGVLWTAGAA